MSVETIGTYNIRLCCEQIPIEPQNKENTAHRRRTRTSAQTLVK